MFDRPATGERALLVHADARGEEGAASEFRELAVSAGALIAGAVHYPERSPDPKFFVGAGKADEVRSAVEAYEAEVVLVDHPLSPAQERNLERHVACRVLDRRSLILDIFAQRASTFEGKLQVELAQLEHLSTRLVRGWTHLERQKGGIGLRGPGETQLETDRRLVDKRIRAIRERLEQVRVRRGLSRRARSRSGVPVVALVGYTNAGKSTLFNRLTGARVLAEDRLFATLDPTLRRLDLGGGDAVVLADTVGFIRQLPHDLVAAFRATLEETKEAQLLVHVVDATVPDRNDRMRDVHDVLRAIGAGAVPRLEVFNKCDELEPARLEAACGWSRTGARAGRSARARAGVGADRGRNGPRRGGDSFACRACASHPRRAYSAFPGPAARGDPCVCARRGGSRRAGRRELDDVPHRARRPRAAASGDAARGVPRRRRIRAAVRRRSGPSPP